MLNKVPLLADPSYSGGGGGGGRRSYDDYLRTYRTSEYHLPPAPPPPHLTYDHAPSGYYSSTRDYYEPRPRPEYHHHPAEYDR